MREAIRDQMSSESENNIFLGLPSSLKFKDALIYDNSLESETTDCVVFFINEATLSQSPQVEIRIAGKFILRAILDSGSEVNLISEGIYEKLTQSGVKLPTLPVEHVVLVTAFGKRSRRIKQQALVEFAIGHDLFESVFLISLQLTNEAIIGCQFLKEYGISIDFGKGTFSYVRGDVTSEHLFTTKVQSKKGACIDRGETKDSFQQNNPSRGQRPHPLSADREPEPHRAVHTCSVYPNPHNAATGSSKDRDLRAGYKIDFMDPGMSKHSQGCSPLMTGTASDQVINEGVDRVVDGYASDVPSSQMVGYVSRGAARKVDLSRQRAESDLHSCKSIPRPEPGSSDPRSYKSLT
jgi:hypothetical protein